MLKTIFSDSKTLKLHVFYRVELTTTWGYVRLCFHFYPLIQLKVEIPISDAVHKWRCTPAKLGNKKFLFSHACIEMANFFGRKRGKKIPFFEYTRKMRELSTIPVGIINNSRIVMGHRQRNIENIDVFVSMYRCKLSIVLISIDVNASFPLIRNKMLLRIKNMF